MGVTAIVPIEPGEAGLSAAHDILEAIAEFSDKAGFAKDDVVKVTCVSTGLRDKKTRIDISLQIPTEEIDEEPDYEIVEVIVRGGMMGGTTTWEIRPISYNPPKYPFSGVIETEDDQPNWKVYVDLMLRALAHLYTYRAEVFGEAANDNRSEAVALRAKTRKLRSKVSDKSLFA